MQIIRQLLEEMLQEKKADEIIRSLFSSLFGVAALPAHRRELDLLRSISKLLPVAFGPCIEFIDSLARNDLEKVALYASAIRFSTNHSLWLHYNIVVALNRLLIAGNEAARMPCLVHSFLTVQSCQGKPEARSALGVPSAIIAREIQGVSPRDSIRNGLESVVTGITYAKNSIFASAQQLGIPVSENPSPFRLLDLRKIAKQCELPYADKIVVRSIKEIDKGLYEEFEETEKSTIAWPMPEGDSNFYLFTIAKQSITVPPIQLYCIKNGTYSIDISARGRAEFYVFDKNGICIDDLSWGGNPFILDECDTINGPVGIIDDRFSGAMNICHLLLDRLPRIEAYKNRFSNSRMFWVEQHKYYDQVLAMTGIDKYAVKTDKKRVSIQADILMITSNNLENWHPAHLGSTWAVDYLRKLFLLDESMHGEPSKQSRRIYISRSDAKNRRVANENEILPELELRGFEVVTLTELSAFDQVRLFAHASIVVAPHGAGLTNIAFAPRKAKVMEIFSPLYGTKAYWVLCAALGHRYTAFVGFDKEYPTPDYTTWVHREDYLAKDIWVDRKRFATALDALVECQ